MAPPSGSFGSARVDARITRSVPMFSWFCEVVKGKGCGGDMSIATEGFLKFIDGICPYKPSSDKEVSHDLGNFQMTILY